MQLVAHVLTSTAVAGIARVSNYIQLKTMHDINYTSIFLLIKAVLVLRWHLAGEVVPQSLYAI